MAILYGPDTFTVGVDAPLTTYNAGWENVVDGGTSPVVSATYGGVVAYDGGFGNMYGVAVWRGANSPTGYQKITADINYNPTFPAMSRMGILCRMSGTGATLNGYLIAMPDGMAVPSISLDTIVDGMQQWNFIEFGMALDVPTVIVEVTGSSIKVTCNGVSNTLTDATYPSGNPGIYLAPSYTVDHCIIDSYMIEGDLSAPLPPYRSPVTISTIKPGPKPFRMIDAAPGKTRVNIGR